MRASERMQRRHELYEELAGIDYELSLIFSDTPTNRQLAQAGELLRPRLDTATALLEAGYHAESLKYLAEEWEAANG